MAEAEPSHEELIAVALVQAVADFVETLLPRLHAYAYCKPSLKLGGRPSMMTSLAPNGAQAREGRRPRLEPKISR